MSALLRVSTQGIQGKNQIPAKEQGLTICVVDGDKSWLTFDAFEGAGTNYRRRESTEITIEHDGERLFRGGFQELITLIKKGKAI